MKKSITSHRPATATCALLITGDFSWLDLCRSQLDLLWAQRREEKGVIVVPARHGDQGWFDFRAPDPYLYIHLYYLSQSAEDRARLDEVFPTRAGFERLPEDWGASKAGICPPGPWFAFTEGRNPGFPEQIAASTYHCVGQSLERMANDRTDPEERECYHFQPLNPVLPEGLIQLAN